MNLVIVESPAKARTISKFLSKKYKVMASLGHLIDLPKSKLGVDVEDNFKPNYITVRGRGKILSELKAAGKKAEQIFLAADPDREGEAICWHLGRALNLDPKTAGRVEFNEITKEAVKEAFKNPRVIDLNRVDAQQARRVLDRLVGYQISPLLWRKIRGGLSAGRVQSVAVRLICDREEEINNFQEEEYWTIEALLKEKKKASEFKATLERYKQKKIKLSNEDDANRVLDELKNERFFVETIKRSKKRRMPAAPYITSSLQQDASNRLGFSSKKTMSLAQELYEGVNIGGGATVGLITYMRTDSTRISAEAQKEARKWLESRYGKDYIPTRAPVYKARQGAQEAHEAIRPTMVVKDPAALKDYLSRDQQRLYKLIWERFMASQMSPALYDQVKVTVQAGDYSLNAGGSTLLFDGFLALSQNNEPEKTTVLPVLAEKEELQLKELLPQQHFTQPPPRFNEASLIKTLEEKGIGRPSTYSPIIDRIQTRGYVLKEQKVFRPTELGFVVTEMMKSYFPEVMDIDFTARLEQQLDDIETGKLKYLQVISDFYDGYFKERLKTADQKIEKVELTPEVTDEICPKCGRQLVVKHGRFGRFLACPGYPECKYTKKIVNDTGVKCPRPGCSGTMIERRTKKGRLFYGCSRYPQCDFSLWQKPLPEPCPKCGSLMTEKRKGPVKTALCTNKDCGFEKKFKEAKLLAKG